MTVVDRDGLVGSEDEDDPLIRLLTTENPLNTRIVPSEPADQLTVDAGIPADLEFPFAPPSNASSLGVGGMSPTPSDWGPPSVTSTLGDGGLSPTPSNWGEQQPGPSSTTQPGGMLPPPPRGFVCTYADCQKFFQINATSTATNAYIQV